MSKHFTKTEKIVQAMDRGNAPVFELIRCFEQGERDRKNGRSFNWCTYSDDRKVKAWEAGYESVSNNKHEK